MKRRNEGIELLRCIAMTAVIFWHCIGHGPYAGACKGFPTALMVLVAWHVDAFIAISGWFGIKFTWRKVLRLIGLFTFYSVLSIGYVLLTTKRLSISDVVVSGGWFGACYLSLMCLAPLLNVAVENLKEKPLPFILSIWIPLAILFTYNWLPPPRILDVRAKGVCAYTLYQFVFLYVTARLARIVHERFNLRNYARWGVFAYFGIVAVFLVCGHDMPVFWRQSLRIFNYDNPLVWGVAIAFVVLFSGMRLNPLLGRFCQFVAPSLFSLYLFQDTTSFRNVFYWALERRIGESLGIGLAIFLTGALTIVLALTIDMLRRLCLFGLGWLNRRC